MNRKDKQAGFTLVEILLVVVIIGILMGVAMPKLSGQRRRAEISAAKADVEAIGTALRLYELDMGEFPKSIQGLLSAPGNARNWSGPYLEKGMPTDPWGNSYVYITPGSHNPHSYDLKTLGPDGVESGDDIGNWTSTSTQ